MKASTVAANRFNDELFRLKSDLEELIHRAPTLSGDDLEHAKEKVMKTAASVRGLRPKSLPVPNPINPLNHINTISNYVRENPMTAMGIAVGLGIATHFLSFTSHTQCENGQVRCNAGPDDEGKQHPERCCESWECTGPNGYR